jgi:hypothetical protein
MGRIRERCASWNPTLFCLMKCLVESKEADGEIEAARASGGRNMPARGRLSGRSE